MDRYGDVTIHRVETTSASLKLKRNRGAPSFWKERRRSVGYLQ